MSIHCVNAMNLSETYRGCRGNGSNGSKERRECEELHGGKNKVDKSGGDAW